jgi:regulatory protein
MGNQTLITAISAGKHPGHRRSDIFLDGKFAFSLDNEVIDRESLKVGKALSQQDIAALTNTDVYQRGLNAALHFLSYRPRSEAEIKQRLERQGYDTDTITRVLAHLKHLELVNDTAFAEYWKENRNTFRPRSQRIIKLELRRKGVDIELIDDAVQDMDDVENAYRTALAKARNLPLSDFQVFRQKLGGHLQRRGFSYGVINNIVKQVWQEKTQEINQELNTNN